MIPANKYGRRVYRFLAATARDYGITSTINHNKAVGHGWSNSRQVSHHNMPVGHIIWRLHIQQLVPTLWLRQRLLPS